MRKVRAIMAALNRLYDHRQGQKTSSGNTHDLQTVAAAHAHRRSHNCCAGESCHPLTTSVNDEGVSFVFHGVVWGGVERPFAS